MHYAWDLKVRYIYTIYSAQSWQYRDRRKPKAGTTMPYSYLKRLQVFFIVHSATGSTVHSMALNSLKHCIPSLSEMVNTFFCYTITTISELNSSAVGYLKNPMVDTHIIHLSEFRQIVQFFSAHDPVAVILFI